MKIAIVGASYSNWDKKLIPVAKDMIRKILSDYHNPILVSGHCPKGEELWYCVDCKGWGMRVKDKPTIEECDYHPNRVIKVYDKGGIDTWAEIIATELRIEKEIYSPEVHQWNDKWDICGCGDPSCDRKLKGYRSRNIEIAESCDVLYCIEPIGRKRSGGIWTMKYANKLGKETHLVVIE